MDESPVKKTIGEGVPDDETTLFRCIVFELLDEKSA